MTKKKLEKSRFRIVYSVNSYRSEFYVHAKSEDEAKQKFIKLKGCNPAIISIEECILLQTEEQNT